MRSIGRMLCDGQWHRLLARKTKHSMSLKVDGRSYTAANPYPQSTSAETKNPVYLGGYPGEYLPVCAPTFNSTCLTVSAPVCPSLHPSVSPSTPLSTCLSLTVGVKQNCLSITSGFRGCLKNAQLVKSHLSDALELSSAHSFWGITPHSCPVA